MVNRYSKGLGQLFVLVLVAVSLVLASAAPADAARKHRARVARSHHRAAPEPDRYSSIVIDANTGYVLSEKDADVRRFPASLSKMMTLYLVFEGLENGTLEAIWRIPRLSGHRRPLSLTYVESGSVRT